MAQTGFTPIQLYSTSTAAAAPVAGNLTNSTLGSELAINITDGKLFYKDNANAVQVIAWKTTPTTAGGTGLTTYTAGDLSYYATGTTFTKLAIGTTGQILTSTGSAPQWSTLSGVAVTTFSAGTTGFTPNSATSGAITLAGTLITSNGGTGLSSYTAGDLSYYASGTALTKLAIGASGRFLSSTGSAPQWSAPAALTEVDDTNVTMTLGGTPSTALLSSVSMTLGWTGQLAVGRGGTGLSTLTTGRIPYGAGASAFNSSANLTFNGTTLTTTGLSVSTASAFAAISSTTTGNPRYLLLNNSADSHNAYIYCAGLSAGFVQADANAGSFLYFSTQNIERMRVHGSGGVSIGNTTDPGATNLSVTGNLVIATSGKGIDFSATAGTGTSELLADYEEGNCSLTVTAASGTITTASASALYTKVGRTVLISGTVTITNNGTGAGALNIAGLPFTPNGNACGVGREAVNNGKTCSFMVSGGSTTMNVYAYDNTYPVATGSTIQFSVSYTV
jgi:hypothetical protein